MKTITTRFTLTYLNAAIIATALILTGCEGKTPSTESNTTQASDVSTISSDPDVTTPIPPAITDTSHPPSVGTKPATNLDSDPSNTTPSISAQDVTMTTRPLNYQLPTQVTEVCVTEPEDSEIECPNFEIELADIEPEWIEEIVNDKITSMESSDFASLKEQMDSLALAQIEEGASMGYGMSIVPTLKAPYNNVAQFTIERESYFGGAHGMYSTDYLLFDMDAKSQLALADVLTKPEIFSNLAYQVYQNYLQTTLGLFTPEEIASYEENFPFGLTDNFYFNEQGLTLVYQPYEMGAYAQGYIELTIPHTDLGRVVKPAYLP